MKSEFELIEAIARRTRRARKDGPGVVVGIGDDAAVLRFAAREDVVLTTDAMVEGRHFERGWLKPREIGWRLAAVNLSDIAAVGATPRYALMSLVLPKRVKPAEAEAIEAGAAEHLAKYKTSIVGGNIASIEGPLVCEMTIIGTCQRGAAWTRSGARKSDAIVVAGTLGAAAAAVVTPEIPERRSRILASDRINHWRVAGSVIDFDLECLQFACIERNYERR